MLTDVWGSYKLDSVKFVFGIVQTLPRNCSTAKAARISLSMPRIALLREYSV